MTSPVDTSVKLAWSGMTNAPVLNGQAGSLISILDACLVTGFDIKPLTSLTVANGVATATFTGNHSAQLDSVILIEGVTGALVGLNGEHKVTARPTADTLTFATTQADGAAAGAITLKMAPAGWAKPFAATNKAVYTPTDPQSLGMFLRVDDGNATSARVRGFESMMDVDTGTGLFPTDAMVAGGGYWNKASVANTTAVPWVVAADSRMAMLWMAANIPSGNATYNSGAVYAFGDPIALKPGGDAYSAILACDSASGTNQGGIDVNSGGTHVALPRNYSGLGSSVWYLCFTYTGNNSNAFTSGHDTTLGAFPNVITGQMYFSRRYLASASNQPPRADLPGIYSVPQDGLISYFNTGNTVAAAGHLQGRNLFALRTTSGSFWNNFPLCVSFIDQTGPWR